MSAIQEVSARAEPPSPPFITGLGISNFRDLGGYPVAASKAHSIRTNVVYRCGEPSNITKDGIATVDKLGITHIYDLRSNNEIQRNWRNAEAGGPIEWDGCKRVFVPVFEDMDYSPEKLAVRYKDYSQGVEGFTRAYTSILNAAGPAYKPILLHLAHEPSKPLIVHCTAGKDRTGVICALLLALCGVDDDVIADEYHLTEIGTDPQWRKAAMEHLMQNPALKDNPAGAISMLGANPEAMLATLKIIREQYDGPEAYMIERCGLTKEEVERIRSNLVVEEPALHLKSQQSL